MDGDTITTLLIGAFALTVYFLDKPIKKWVKEEEQ